MHNKDLITNSNTGGTYSALELTVLLAAVSEEACKQVKAGAA